MHTTLHFLSFQPRWNVEKIEYSQWLRPKTFRTFTIDNDIPFQSWHSLFRVTITHCIRPRSFVVIMSFHATSIFLIDRIKRATLFSERWNTFATVSRDRNNKNLRAYVSCCLKKLQLATIYRDRYGGQLKNNAHLRIILK